MTNTGILIIDVQESFRALPSWNSISNPKIVEVLQKLVQHARKNNDHVVWVLHHEPGTGNAFEEKRGYVKLLQGLEAEPEDICVLKTSHNAFTTTNLAQQLQSRGINSLRLCGIRAEQCVETTARLASDMGFNVEVILDATATHPLPLWNSSRILSAQEIIDRTTAVLSGRFATITTSDEVLAQ